MLSNRDATTWHYSVDTTFDFHLIYLKANDIEYRISKHTLFILLNYILFYLQSVKFLTVFK